VKKRREEGFFWRLFFFVGVCVCMCVRACLCLEVWQCLCFVLCVCFFRLKECRLLAAVATTEREVIASGGEKNSFLFPARSFRPHTHALQTCKPSPAPPGRPPCSASQASRSASCQAPSLWRRK